MAIPVRTDVKKPHGVLAYVRDLTTSQNSLDSKQKVKGLGLSVATRYERTQVNKHSTGTRVQSSIYSAIPEKHLRGVSESSTVNIGIENVVPFLAHSYTFEIQLCEARKSTREIDD